MPKLQDMLPLKASRYEEDYISHDCPIHRPLSPSKMARLKREQENVGNYFTDDELPYYYYPDFKKCCNNFYDFTKCVYDNWGEFSDYLIENKVIF